MSEVSVLGHSTGGITATRFTLMNSDRVTHPALDGGRARIGRLPSWHPAAVRGDFPLGQYATPAEAKRLGDFVELSAEAVRDIPSAKRVVVPECGHIPHLEHPDQFLAELLSSLKS